MAFPPKTRPFTQPPQRQMAHPSSNLGTFLHPARPKASSHAETKVPRSPERQYVPPDGDYKPTVAQKASKFAKPVSVAGVNMGGSDINSEAIGDAMGPANVSTTPAPLKTRKVNAKQMPFYGRMK